MLTLKTLTRVFYKALNNTISHDGIEHAGYLAFVALLSLFPFLVFIVAVMGFIGEGDAGTQFINFLFAHLPSDMVMSLRPRVAEIISGPPQGLLTIAIVGAIWTASSSVEGYRTVLNRAYDVTSPPAYVWRRLLSIAQTLILSFILVLGMLTLIVTPILSEKFLQLFGRHFHLEGDFSTVIAYISVATIFFVVSAAYYFLPNIKQTLHVVAPGAAIVTMLWLEAARALSYYFSQFHQVNLIYGSLGGIIATMLFFYVSNIIFIYGAEFNHLIKLALGEPDVKKVKD